MVEKYLTRNEGGKFSTLRNRGRTLCLLLATQTPSVDNASIKASTIASPYFWTSSLNLVPSKKSSIVLASVIGDLKAFKLAVLLLANVTVDA